MKKVAIVIGHGPKLDRGAYSLDKKTNELDWNEELAAMILLNLKTVQGIIVRRKTERLQPVAETNATNADCAIELHLNSADGNPSGTEMICLAESKEANRLASLLQANAVEVLDLPDRGVKAPFKGRGARWLKGTTMPAVIAEWFFINNDEDLSRGNDRKELLAVATARAIEKFLN